MPRNIIYLFLMPRNIIYLFLMPRNIISPKFLNGTEKSWIRPAIIIPSGNKSRDFLKFCGIFSMTLLNVLRRLTCYILIYFFFHSSYTFFIFSLVILYEFANLLNILYFHLVKNLIFLRSDLMNYVSGINS
jgi:hypothetical protein